MYKFILTWVAALFILMPHVNAQTWEVGGSAAAAGYIGDFNPANPLKFTDPAFGIFIKRNINQFLSFKVNYTHANISGADSTSSNQQLRDRNLSFSSTLGELSLVGELNFLPYMPQIGHNIFTPFIFVGIGNVKYNPVATYQGQEYDLRSLMTEGQKKAYSQNALAVPYGAGIKYNFSGAWNLIVDLGYRTTNTGYLDDVNGLYADKSSLPNALSRALSDRSGEINGNYLGSPGSQRGNMRNSDTYMFLGFTISYTFLTSKCYSFN